MNKGKCAHCGQYADLYKGYCQPCIDWASSVTAWTYGQEE